MPDRLTIPIFPTVWIYPGMIPILHSPGFIIPGQLGPIKREFEDFNMSFTRIMSCCGIPYVIVTIRGISAYMLSIIALAAKGGGT